jgi:hypothetical protein
MHLPSYRDIIGHQILMEIKRNLLSSQCCHSDSPLPTGVLVMGDKLYTTSAALGNGCSMLKIRMPSMKSYSIKLVL